MGNTLHRRSYRISGDSSNMERILNKRFTCAVRQPRPASDETSLVNYDTVMDKVYLETSGDPSVLYPEYMNKSYNNRWNDSEEQERSKTATHAIEISDSNSKGDTKMQALSVQQIEVEDETSIIALNDKTLPTTESNLRKPGRPDSGYSTLERDDQDDYEDGSPIEVFMSLLTMLDLQKCFVEDFTRLPLDIRHHRDYDDWIMIFLENKFAAIENINLTQALSEELLIEIGFVGNSNAVHTILIRSKIFVPKHLEPLDAAKCFVGDEFRYNSNLPNEFQLQEDCKVEQEVQKRTFPVHTLSVDCAITIKGTILEDSVLTKPVMAIIEELRKADDQAEVWFHGTDDQSALDISRGGITLSTGSRRRDFSDGKGFYLTNNVEDAKNWAFSITQRPAVLIFKIPKSYLEAAKKLNLFEESETIPAWEEIVSANRSGVLSWKMRMTLEQYECIEGPVSVVPETDKAKDGDSGATISREPQPDTHQICIVDEDFADVISNCLSKVVLYNVLGEQDLFLSKPKRVSFPTN